MSYECKQKKGKTINSKTYDGCDIDDACIACNGYSCSFHLVSANSIGIFSYGGCFIAKT